MFKAIKSLVVSIVLLLSVGAGAQRPALQKLSPLVREACLGVQQTGRFNRVKAFNQPSLSITAFVKGTENFAEALQSFRPIGDAFAFSFHPPHRGRTTKPGADGHYRHHRFIR